jgi:hypothetical protein
MEKISIIDDDQDSAVITDCKGQESKAARILQRMKERYLIVVLAMLPFRGETVK